MSTPAETLTVHMPSGGMTTRRRRRAAVGKPKTNDGGAASAEEDDEADREARRKLMRLNKRDLVQRILQLRTLPPVSKPAATTAVAPNADVVADLEERLRCAAQEAQKLTSEHEQAQAELRAQLLAAHNEVQRYASAADVGLQARETAAAEDMRHLREELARRDRANAELAGQVKRLVDEQDAAQKTAHQASRGAAEEVQHLREELARRDHTNAELSGQVKRLVDEHAERMQKLQTENATLVARIADVREQGAREKQEVVALREKLASMRIELRNAEREKNEEVERTQQLVLALQRQSSQPQRQQSQRQQRQRQPSQQTTTSRPQGIAITSPPPVVLPSQLQRGPAQRW